MSRVNFNQIFQQKQISSQNNSLNKRNSIPFGCRILAVMGPTLNHSPEHDQFVRSSLGFLKEESEEKRKPRDGFFNSLNIEDLKGSPKFGNPDGWGIIDYIKNKLFHRNDLRNTEAAYKGDKFDKAIEKVVKDSPDIIIAHVRWASDPNSVDNINNTHPFTYKNWGFIHNGFVNIPDSLPLSNQLKLYQDRYGFKLKGTTDSEQAFYYILGKMKDFGIDLESDNVDIEKAKVVFAQAVNEIVSQSKPHYKNLDGTVMNIKGAIQKHPACNFVLSNGKFILAYRNANKLYLGKSKLTSGQNEYIISSETFQDLEDNITVKWFTIPQNYIVTLSKDNEGKTSPALYPLNYFLTPHPEE